MSIYQRASSLYSRHFDKCVHGLWYFVVQWRICIQLAGFKIHVQFIPLQPCLPLLSLSPSLFSIPAILAPQNTKLLCASGPLHMPSLLSGMLSQDLHISCPLLTRQLLTEMPPIQRSLLIFLSTPGSQSPLYPITLHPVTVLNFSLALCIQLVDSTDIYWAPTMCQWLLLEFGFYWWTKQ